MSGPIATPDDAAVLQFTPDNRYVTGTFVASEPVDGQPEEWVMPFLGWAVVVDRPDHRDAAWTSDILPVFLREDGGGAWPLSTVEQLLKGKLVRLTPAEPGGLR